ncbi:MFS transporter [Pelotomaculum propionicicum]|uniref:Inner membrane metabolite transport protein YdjE n=1 Tax=Pelotomaculum propionicicum TaxID=258475 RepID=A0A4Y7RBM4_9FIRM|nr:MFS transporter [Pelotomaculum propionicicum]TEB06418.1 Inner membrane metabolite transport protein YdjE [Pelotomaculum propionicicum]
MTEEIFKSEGKIKNNYFDGMHIRGRHLVLYAIIAMVYFFEQLDNMLLGFVAPAVIKTFGITAQLFAPAQSLYFIGMMLGGFCGGMISDRIGRRKTILYALILTSASCIITGFTDNITTFTIFRTLTGFGVFCTTIVAITYVAEITPAKQRGKWEGICATFAFMATPAIGAVAAKVVPLGPEAWRYIFDVGILGFVAAFFVYFLLDETPRWLVSKGRVAEAEAMVEKISGIAVDLSDQAKFEAERVKISVWQGLVSLVQGKYLGRTVLCFLIGFAQQAPSFALLNWNNTLLQLNGIPAYESMMISTLGTIGMVVGTFISAWVGPLGGRKIPIGVSLLITSIMIMIYINVGSNFVLLATFLFLFQTASMCAAYCIYPYQAESFPTSVRNSATGVINAGARLGTSGTLQIVPFLYAAGGFATFGTTIAIMSAVPGILVLLFGWRTGMAPLEEVS